MKVNKNSYCVYIVTNSLKTVLYIGVTNNLAQRITEHYMDRISRKSFAGKYACHYLVYYETYTSIAFAIEREKELKGWKRIKKELLILSFNPGWDFLNKELLGEWPPTNLWHRGEK